MGLWAPDFQTMEPWRIYRFLGGSGQRNPPVIKHGNGQIPIWPEDFLITSPFISDFPVFFHGFH